MYIASNDLRENTYEHCEKWPIFCAIFWTTFCAKFCAEFCLSCHDCCGRNHCQRWFSCSPWIADHRQTCQLCCNGSCSLTFNKISWVCRLERNALWARYCPRSTGRMLVMSGINIRWTTQSIQMWRLERYRIHWNTGLTARALYKCDKKPSIPLKNFLYLHWTSQGKLLH